MFYGPLSGLEPATRSSAKFDDALSPRKAMVLALGTCQIARFIFASP